MQVREKGAVCSSFEIFGGPLIFRRRCKFFGEKNHVAFFFFSFKCCVVFVVFVSFLRVALKKKKKKIRSSFFRCFLLLLFLVENHVGFFFISSQIYTHTHKVVTECVINTLSSQ